MIFNIYSFTSIHTQKIFYSVSLSINCNCMKCSHKITQNKKVFYLSLLQLIFHGKYILLAILNNIFNACSQCLLLVLCCIYNKLIVLLCIFMHIKMYTLKIIDLVFLRGSEICSILILPSVIKCDLTHKLWMKGLDANLWS